MVMGLAGPGIKNDCAGEGQQQFTQNRLVLLRTSCFSIISRLTISPGLLGNIVTDLINALPGNSSVNSAQHATIEKNMFSLSAVTSRHVTCVFCDTCPFLGYISDRICSV
jgi:hypothetical protein